MKFLYGSALQDIYLASVETVPDSMFIGRITIPSLLDREVVSRGLLVNDWIMHAHVWPPYLISIYGIRSGIAAFIFDFAERRMRRAIF